MHIVHYKYKYINIHQTDIIIKQYSRDEVHMGHVHKFKFKTLLVSAIRLHRVSIIVRP